VSEKSLAASSDFFEDREENKHEDEVRLNFENERSVVKKIETCYRKYWMEEINKKT